MSERNLFKIAARNKMRFPSPKGALIAEQLYDLRLPDLDAVARAVNSELKSLTEESFVEIRPDPRKGMLQDQLDLVKEVIADKLADKAAAERRQRKADLRKTLTAALARKQDEALSSASIDELRRQIAELDEE